MKAPLRQYAFLIGWFSLGAQVILLRQTTATFGGSEILIGFGLTGWLLAVAVGAAIGGMARKARSMPILTSAAGVILVFCFTLVRMSPRLISSIVFEEIDLATAAATAFVAMLPVGSLCGWMFAEAARMAWRPATGVAQVYLWEGLGAFVAGLTVTILTGLVNDWYSVLMVCTVTMFGIRWTSPLLSLSTAIGAAMFALLAFAWAAQAPEMVESLDSACCRPFEVLESFDTPYSHQIIARRDEQVFVVTNNRTEAIVSDTNQAETIILPSLLMHPEAERIFIDGSVDGLVAAITKGHNRRELVICDPRRKVQRFWQDLAPAGTRLTRISDDPLSYLGRQQGRETYDIIILRPGPLDTYTGGRLLNRSALQQIKGQLAADGLLSIILPYDTERYLSQATQAAVATVYHTVADVFPGVGCWPGTSTIIWASTDRELSIPVDTLTARLAAMPYQPRYVRDDYLIDQLSPMPSERLLAAISKPTRTNSRERPTLMSIHLQHQAQTKPLAQALVSPLSKTWLGPILIALLALVVLGPLCRARIPTNSMGRSLLLLAGFGSIAVELVVVYLYQSTAGALHTDLGVLFGAFMLGLALGTYTSITYPLRSRPAWGVGLLLLVIVLLATTWHLITADTALVYYSLTLVTLGLATGSLFVVGSSLMYGDRFDANRGVSYAWDLVGSAAGALFTLTILLPQVGVTGILAGLGVIVAVVTFVGRRQG
ncbi:MAG: hypothetical protein ABIE70_00495 [bacterium]